MITDKEELLARIPADREIRVYMAIGLNAIVACFTPEDEESFTAEPEILYALTREGKVELRTENVPHAPMGPRYPPIRFYKRAAE